MTQDERAELAVDPGAVRMPLWALLDPKVSMEMVEQAVADDIAAGIAEKRRLAVFERRLRRI